MKTLKEALFNKKNLDSEINKFLNELCDKLEIKIISTEKKLKYNKSSDFELADVFKIVGKKNLYIAVCEGLPEDEYDFYFTFFETEDRNFYLLLKFLYATGRSRGFDKMPAPFWESNRSLIEHTKRIKRSIYNWK